MRYDEPRDKSAELLRLTLPLMAQQHAGFHPVSFTLWYEHAAGVNPQLSQVLAPRLEANQPLTDDETYDLYARHVIARDMQMLHHGPTARCMRRNVLAVTECVSPTRRG